METGRIVLRDQSPETEGKLSQSLGHRPTLPLDIDFTAHNGKLVQWLAENEAGRVGSL